MKAVILAGGFGKRLKPLTDDRPKPLVEVLGKPILEWQLKWLRSHGITDIIICTGYKKEMIMNYVGSGSKFDVNVKYAVEEEPLGTGGALKNTASLISKGGPVLALNGDILTDFNPAALTTIIDDDTLGSIAVVPLKSPFGIVDFSQDTVISGFREKPLLKEYWINAGVYCLSSDVFNYLPDKGNVENTAFPKLANEGRLKAVKYLDSLWKSIDTHKDIEEVNKEFNALTE